MLTRLRKISSVLGLAALGILSASCESAFIRIIYNVDPQGDLSGTFIPCLAPLDRDNGEFRGKILCDLDLAINSEELQEAGYRIQDDLTFDTYEEAWEPAVLSSGNVVFEAFLLNRGKVYRAASSHFVGAPDERTLYAEFELTGAQAVPNPDFVIQSFQTGQPDASP